MTRISIILLFVIASHASAQTSPWEPMNRGLLHTLVYCIEIDPVDPLRMYCGTDYGNIYTSTDGGFNWKRIVNGIPTTYSGERVTALFLDKNDPRVLYAGFGGRQSTKNLFRSTNRGEDWFGLPTPSEWQNRGILHILKTGTNPARLLCGLGWDFGIQVSTNEGSTWVKGIGDRGIQTIAAHPTNPFVMIAGASAFGSLLRSTNGGTSWAASTSGMPGASFGVRSCSFSPSNPNVVYAGITGHGAAGLFKSTDAGVTWSRLNNVSEISEIAIYPEDENIIYISAISTGVWRTRDGGVTWKQLKEGLPTTNVMRVRIAGGYPVRVFAMTLSHGIFRMVDEEI